MYPTSLFFDILLGGIILGALYSLISLGLNLQFGVTKVLNVAHGEFMIIASYLSYVFFTSFKMDPFFSLLIILPFFFFIGFALERGLFGRLFLRLSVDEAVSISLLMCFGLMFIIQNVLMLIFGRTEKSYEYFSQTVDIAGAIFPLNRIIVGVAGVVLNFAIYNFLTFTQPGRALRASIMEPIGAQLVGINISKLRSYALGLGLIASGLAGMLISMFYAITPYSGSVYTIIALIVIILGGFGSMLGSILGGITLGFVSYVTMRFMSSTLVLVVFYAIFLLILLIRPQGLFRR